MRSTVSLIILFCLIVLPSLAIDEQYSSFVGQLVNVDSASKQKDYDKLKMLLKSNSSSKNLSNYAFYSNNHWFLLDKNTNSLTKQLLINGKIKAGSYFMIKGHLHNNVIIVKQITEIKTDLNKFLTVHQSLTNIIEAALVKAAVNADPYSISSMPQMSLSFCQKWRGAEIGVKTHGTTISFPNNKKFTAWQDDYCKTNF